MKDVKQELKNELIDRLFKDVDIIKANTLIDGLIEKNSVPREPDDGDINKMSKTQLKRLIRDYKGDIDKRNRYNELKKELKNRR